MKLRMRTRQRALLSLSSLALLAVLLAALRVSQSLLQSSRAAPPPRLAYFIQVSAANIALLPRLVVSLYHRDNVYALHLDRKIADAVKHEALRSVYAEVGARWGRGPAFNVPNIVLLRSEIVTYRGPSITLNYLSGVHRLLAAGPWHYFINLSAADYPTASQAVIRRLLGRAPPATNFVEWKPRGTWAGFAEKRLAEFYVDTALAKLHADRADYVDATGANVTSAGAGVGPAAVVRVQNPLHKHLDYTVAKTSGWFVLSRRFCEHVVRDADARKLLGAFSFSDASDEHYFGTVLWNGGARWRDGVVASNLRSIFFVAPNGSFALGDDGVRSRQHPFWVDEVDERGDFLFWRDLMRVPAFFTRKVRDAGAFRDKVDREMIGIGDGAAGREARLKVAAYEKLLEKRFMELIEEAVEKHKEAAWPDEEED